MSLLKLPFLISLTWGINTSMTRPRPPPPPHEQLDLQPNAAETLTLGLPLVAKVGGHWTAQGTFWLVALCEGAVILAHNINPSHPLSSRIIRLLVWPPGSEQHIRLSPLFIAGWILSLTGALLRRRCYKTLESMFTFELSIRENHHLVTRGPYAVVRHPSYTGAVLCGAGAVLCHMARGSWLLECSGLLPNSWSVFWGTLGLGTAVVVGVLGSRMAKEDAMLKKRFGLQWDAWAVNVPYRLVPGVL